MKINVGKRFVAAALCFAIMLSFLPADVLSAGNSDADYLMFATDRHGDTQILGTLLESIESDIGDGLLDYVGLGGDMVDDTESYNSSTVLGEVTAVADHLSAAKVDILYASHDENCNDNAGILHDASGLWATLDNCYVYGIVQSDMESASAAQFAAQNFTDWVESLTDDKAILVLSHMPIHAKRGDNLGAGYWHNALNAAATGSATGTVATRNVAFFHGHNHTVDTQEYYYAPGQTMSVESYVAPSVATTYTDTITAVYDNETATYSTASGTNATVYYTYATAGYLSQTVGNGQATLVEVTEDSITFTKYAADSTTVLGTVDRSSTTIKTVGITADYATDIYATGLGLTDMEVVMYESADLTELYGGDMYFPYGITLTGYVEGDTVTVSVYYYDYDMSDAVVYLFEELEDGVTSSFTKVESNAVYVPEDGETASYTIITFEITSATATFSFGQQVVQVPDGYVLTDLEVTSAPDTTKYFVQETNADDVLPLNIAGLEITATYSDGENTLTKEIPWDRFGEVADGYALTVDMKVLGEQDVQVSYTYGDVTLETSFPIWVCAETIETAGVAVSVEKPGVTDIVVTNAITAGATIALTGLVSNYKVYNITLESVDGEGLDGGTATVTLPIPANVTKPVVYYVSDDGRTIQRMTATVNDNSTITFETGHFSTYVVGQDTGITVPDPETAEINNVSTTESKTVYVLTDTFTSGEKYLIVDANSGTGNVLINNNGSVGNATATIESGALTIDGTTATQTYIVLDNSNAVWTAGTSGSKGALKSNGYYLYHKSGKLSLVQTTDNTNWTWDGDDSYLYYSGGGNNKYLVYNGGWEISETADNLYLYREENATVEVSNNGIYSIAGNPAEIAQVVGNGSTATLGSTLTFTSTGGTVTTTDTTTTATYTIYDDPETTGVDGDPANVIYGISGNTITFTGNYGKALVKVSYTDTVGTYTVTNYIVVTAQPTYFSLELHKAELTEATGVTADNFASGTYYTYNAVTGTYHEAESYVEGTTYYTADVRQGDVITAPIALKGIEAGDKYSVWAVVTQYTADHPDGEDLGTLGDALSWTVSDTTIATIDVKTGVLTFTGNNYGTIRVTVAYKSADNVLLTDTITLSVTDSLHVVPGDGTNDFPEYPNQGAIRFDKTATAVGNFSQTGIVNVELSMTGVPFSEGNEIDVVIMMDMTGSMSDNAMAAAEEAAIAFAQSIVVNEDGSYNKNRVSVMAFNSDSSSPFTYWSLGTISADQWESFCTEVRGADGDQKSGGTPYDEALAKCQSVLAAAKTDGTGNNRQQFCVFMSDGGPTSYEYITNYDEVKAGEDNAYTTKSASATGGSNQSDSNFATIATYTHENYSTLMKDDGVTMYSVLTGLVAADYPNCTTIMQNIASDSSKAYVVEAGTDTAALSGVLTGIGQEIKDAAKNVKVEDKISDDFTMVFDAPNAVVDEADGGQEYYIEVKKYPLVPEYAKVDITAFASGVTYYTYSNGTYTKATSYTAGTDYYIVVDNHRDTQNAVSLEKVYLGLSNGNYYAAKDASGTAHDTPVFNTTALGNKYYWTNEDVSQKEGYSGVSVTVDSVTYYFVPEGKYDTDSDWQSVSGKWFNLASGAYASGTPTIDNITGDENSTTCQDLIIATHYFVYNAATRMLVWTVDKLQSTELALSYFLYLNESGGYVGDADETPPGSYLTNDYADLTYQNFQNTDCKQEMPVPQVTWNGAQVSYVFYLVNDKGQTVNRAGRVVPFSEAVYVTDVYTTSITWNDLEQTESLDSRLIADDLLPDVYSLFDDEAKYTIHVFEDQNGTNMNNHFKIEGKEGLVNTTYVFNTKAGDKYSALGVYAEKTQIYCKNYDVTDNGDGTYTYDGSDQYLDDNGNPVYDRDALGLYTIVSTTIAEDHKISGFDFANTTVAFAVVFKPELVKDVVVVDFGLPVSVNVTLNDALASGLVGVRLDAPNDVLINSGTYDNAAKATSVDLMIGSTKIGTATVESLTSIRFEFDKTYGMQFTEPLEFYYESAVNYYEDGELVSTNMYSSVTIIPATSIYYEDNFVTYTGTWEGGSQGGVQDTDRPGKGKLSAAYDAENLYGYDSAYKSMATYSMNGSKYTTVSGSTVSTAQFTFYGTGFDVISLTSGDTGTIIVDVYRGNTAEGTAVRSFVVDTYYGADDRLYTVTYHYIDGTWERTVGAVSDATEETVTMAPVVYVEKQLFNVLFEFKDGAWVEQSVGEASTSFTKESKPSVSGSEQEGDTANGLLFKLCAVTYTYHNGKWDRAVGEIVEKAEDVETTQDTTFICNEYCYDLDPNAEGALYQVPVMKVLGLDYGQYTAKISVFYDLFFDHEQNGSAGSYDFYLDAIRIYDPAPMTDETVKDAYIADGEAWPHYYELRNSVIGQGTFGSALPGAAVTGVVFIDGNPKVGDYQMADYVSYGPNNELYLAEGQAVAFKIAKSGKIANVTLGIKAASVGTNHSVSYVINGDSYTISTTNGMNYSLNKYLDSDVIVIQNTGTGILSLTDVKITYTEEPLSAANVLWIDEEGVELALLMLRNNFVMPADNADDIEWPPLMVQPEKPSFAENVRNFFTNLFESLFGWMFA